MVFISNQQANIAYQLLFGNNTIKDEPIQMILIEGPLLLNQYQTY
jgi:hypothetical protein